MNKYANNMPENKISQSNITTHQNVNGIQTKQPSMKSHRSRLATFLLCLFLGGFGIHRFYTGHLLLGLIYLFTGGFFLIGIILDLIFIAFGNYYDADGLLI